MIALLPIPVAGSLASRLRPGHPPAIVRDLGSLSLAPSGLDFDVPTAIIPPRAVADGNVARGTATVEQLYTAPRLRYSGGSILPDEAA